MSETSGTRLDYIVERCGVKAIAVYLRVPRVLSANSPPVLVNLRAVGRPFAATRCR
jgi:hypothetical protein